jgi:hypothetical protein
LLGNEIIGGIGAIHSASRAGHFRRHPPICRLYVKGVMLPAIIACSFYRHHTTSETALTDRATLILSQISVEPLFVKIIISNILSANGKEASNTLVASNKVTNYLQVIHSKFTTTCEIQRVKGWILPIKSWYFCFKILKMSQSVLVVSQNCIDC